MLGDSKMVTDNPDFPGARFYKTDLHVHTSASKCWEGDRDGKELERIFEMLEERGIEVVGITDHNTVCNVERAKELGRERGIHVIPGVEITSKEGHVLALFGEEKPTSEIENWLARMGFVGERLGDLEAMAEDQDKKPISIEKVFTLIENEGGMAIAPHPNSKSRGFLEVMKQKGQARLSAYNSPYLRGLEVSSDREKILKLAEGEVPGYMKKYGCIATSDAHSVDDIAKEFTYIKLGDFGIGALKQVFYDPAMRVRFDDEWPLRRHAWIEEVKASQGFFDGLSFRFHPDMSCLVGGKAVGKSLLIELIRFALDVKSPISGTNDAAEEMVWARTCLGEGGTVTLHVVNENGERYRIQRTVSEFDEGPEVYYGGTETKASDYVSDVFKCQIYSQNEIIDLGKTLPALVDWLDSFIDLAIERDEIKGLRKSVLKLLRELDEKHTLAVQVPELKRKKNELEKKKKLLEEKVKEPILKVFPRWQQEERQLKKFQAGLKRLKEEVLEPMQKVRVEAYIPQPEGETPNREEILGQRETLLELGSTLAKAGKDALEAMSKKVKELKQFTVGWREKFVEAQKKHAEVVKSAGVRNASAITSELNKVAHAIEIVDGRLKQARKASREKGALESTLRGSLMPAYFDAFRRIFKKRLDKAVGIGAALGDFVRINVLQMADRTGFEGAVKKMAKGSGIRKEELEKISSGLTPIRLAELVAERNSSELGREAGIKETTGATFVEHMWERSIADDGSERPSEVYKVGLTELKDSVTVELRVDEKNYKPMKELSGGSKCTAILSVALVEGTCPLIVDQPEDALDNPFVFKQIVKSVRATKTGRQYIFATHNSNVAVASDADLIYCLRATADQGEVGRRGSIDQISTRDEVVANLEGGVDAFKLRSQKYDIEVSDPSGVVLDVR